MPEGSVEVMRVGPAGGGVGHGAHCAHTRPTGRGLGRATVVRVLLSSILGRGPLPPPGGRADTSPTCDDRDGDASRAFRGVRVWSPFRRGTGLHTRDGRAGHTTTPDTALRTRDTGPGLGPLWVTQTS
jgi:hypothetical protein